jgi:hypothetical protein
LADRSDCATGLLSSNCTFSRLVQSIQYALKPNSQPCRIGLEVSLL